MDGNKWSYKHFNCWVLLTVLFCVERWLSTISEEVGGNPSSMFTTDQESLFNRKFYHERCGRNFWWCNKWEIFESKIYDLSERMRENRSIFNSIFRWLREETCWKGFFKRLLGLLTQYILLSIFEDLDIVFDIYNLLLLLAIPRALI